MLLGASAAILSAPARAASMVLAVADIPCSAPVLIAEAEDYFASEGLALETHHFPIGRICLEQLLAGKSHVATVADVPIVVAGFSRRDFGILATTTL